MVVERTFLKNYGYGSFIGILTYNSTNEPKKAHLNYYQVVPNGTLIQLTNWCKETQDLEKLARAFINKQDYFILWSY